MANQLTGAGRHQKIDSFAIAVLLLTTLAFCLRLYHVGASSLWYDELLQVDIAHGTWTAILSQMERHAAMPLDYFLLHGWLKGGQVEFWLRWPALCFGTLAVPLLYSLASALFSRRVGLIAAGLLAVSPFAIQYSREVRPYALLSFLILLSFWGVWQGYRRRRLQYWGLSGPALVGAVLTHYFALFMLIPLALFVAGRQRSALKRLEIWQHTVCFTAVIVLVALSLILTGRFRPLYNVSFGLSTALSQPERLSLPAEHKPNRGAGPPLSRTFFVDKVLGPLAGGRPAGLLLSGLFFLVAVTSLLARSQTRRTAILLLLGWLIIPIISIYIFLLYRGTFYAIRYILYTLPAFLTLVAYGLDRSWVAWSQGPLFRRQDSPRSVLIQHWLQPAVLALVLAFLFVPKMADLRTYYRTESREDWRAVGQLLQRYARPDDVVLAIRAEPAINWYYPPARADFGAYNRTEQVWQAINSHRRRWFVLSSYSRSQDKALRDWLANNEAVLIGIDRRVVLYVQEQGRSAPDLLAEIKAYALPQKPLTYASLAGQLYRQGDDQTGQIFYRRALELADPELKGVIERQRATTLRASPASAKGF